MIAGREVALIEVVHSDSLICARHIGSAEIKGFKN